MESEKSLALIIPAHNEEQRIAPTLRAYHSFFNSLEQHKKIDFELIIVLNGCNDKTSAVVKAIQKNLNNITMLDFATAGKGYALKRGFKHALAKGADLIGFVDADMATSPQEFYKLIIGLNESDGIIASRYMTGAVVTPPRPKIKRWGSKIIFEPLVKMLLGLPFKDLQCGAKLFKRDVIKMIVDHLKVQQWAFDVEILYLCRLFNFTVKEIPTVWHDQVLSKLNTFGGGMKMLSSILEIRKNHAELINNSL